MFHLVIIYFVLVSSSIFANEDHLKVAQGHEQKNLTAESEIGDLCVELNIEEEVAKAVAKTALPLSIDEKFSSTPFLYFFNGIIPKDSRDKRIWSIGGHYLQIVKFGELISVNNLFLCGSLKLSKTKDHLLCKSAQGTRLINFDGTIRDNTATGNICPPIKSTKSISYGNCLMNLERDNLRCKVEITWPSSQRASINKQCLNVDISGDILHCRRKKLKNSEVVSLASYCLTDSSVMTAPKVFDGNRGDLLKKLESTSQSGKEPPSETIKK